MEPLSLRSAIRGRGEVFVKDGTSHDFPYIYLKHILLNGVIELASGLELMRTRKASCIVIL